MATEEINNVEATEANEEVKPVNYGELLRYQNNKQSYWLGMLAVVFSLIYIFVLLNRFQGNGFNAGLFIVILGNIILFLAGFLCCEKMKTYDIKWGYVALVFGAIAIVRAFVYPMFVMTGKVITKEARPGIAIVLMVCMILTAVLYIFAGIITIRKTKILNNYLNEINEPRNI